MKNLFAYVAVIVSIFVSGCANMKDPATVNKLSSLKYDEHSKIYLMNSPEFSVSDSFNGFYNAGISKAWIASAVDVDTATPLTAIRVTYEGKEWRFFDSAVDADGGKLPVKVISRDVFYGGNVSEQISIELPADYLEKHKEKGINVRIYGKSDSPVLVINPGYVQGTIWSIEVTQDRAKARQKKS